jgi:hypothetical protein
MISSNGCQHHLLSLAHKPEISDGFSKILSGSLEIRGYRETIRIQSGLNDTTQVGKRAINPCECLFDNY